MTTRPASTQDASPGRRAVPRPAVALAVFLVLVVVELLTAVDTHASTSALTRPGNAVGASRPAAPESIGRPTGEWADEGRGRAPNYDRSAVGSAVAAEGAEEAGSVAFRSDTSHIFRDATGHLLKDTPANRAVIQGAIDPANLRSTITLPNGSTLARYFQTLPDGTQAWVEVRNGVEITNGGVNVTPR